MQNKNFYINSITVSDALSLDIKTLVPDMNMRRRMSKFVKMGVHTGMECLSNYSTTVDSIITATSLGCLTDSEKFLNNIIETNEGTLNPTPFIQSTFNTIASNIAILTKNNNYNMTHVHKYNSFFSALLDAFFQIFNGDSSSVLVGAIDEHIELSRLAFDKFVSSDKQAYQGAIFFVLSAEQTDNSIASIKLMNNDNYDFIVNHKICNDKYPNSFLASAFYLNDAISEINTNQSVLFKQDDARSLDFILTKL